MTEEQQTEEIFDEITAHFKDYDEFCEWYKGCWSDSDLRTPFQVFKVEGKEFLIEPDTGYGDFCEYHELENCSESYEKWIENEIFNEHDKENILEVIFKQLKEQTQMEINLKE